MEKHHRDPENRDPENRFFDRGRNPEELPGQFSKSPAPEDLMAESLPETSDPLAGDLVEPNTKDDEIALLKRKLKGYQTLGHLFQESKQSLAKQKKNIIDLLNTVYFLCSVIWRLLLDVPISSRFKEHLLEFCEGKLGFGFDGEGCEKDVPISLRNVDDKAGSLSMMKEFLTEGKRLLQSEDKAKRQTRGTDDCSDSCSSTRVEGTRPCLVQQNSDQGNENNENKRTSPRSSFAAETLPCSPSQEKLSSMVQKVIVNALGEDVPSEITSDLTGIIIKTYRTEKQLKISQILATNLAEENEKLKVKLKQQTYLTTAKNRELGQLGEENGHLQQQMEHLERRFSRPSPSSSPELLNGEEWVQVEKQKAEQGGVSEVERLEREVKTLKTEKEELMKANGNWEGHCQKVETHSQRELAGVRQDLEEARRSLHNTEGQEQHRREEDEHRIRTLTRRADELEKEKQEEEQRLRKEVILRNEAEAQIEYERQKSSALEAQVAHLEQRMTEQKQAIDTISNDNRTLRLQPLQSLAGGAIESLSEAQLPADIPSMRTAIQLLRQQVIIDKEDFDKERQDREKAKAECEELESRLRDAEHHAADFQHEVHRKDREMEDLNENNRKQQKLLKEKRETIRNLEEHIETGREYVHREPHPRQHHGELYPPVTNPRWGSRLVQGQPLPSQLAVTAVGTWACKACTFENDNRRSTCEMCGAKGGRIPVPVEEMHHRQHHHCYHGRLEHGGYIECDSPQSPKLNIPLPQGPGNLEADGEAPTAVSIKPQE